TGGGLVAGLHAGYNFQTGNIVWGLEGDITHAGNIKNKSFTDQLHTNVLASIRGRLGLAMDRILVYATGGWGWVHGKAVSSNGLGGNGPFRSFSRSSPVVGGGIEWAATNNLTYRIEVLDFIRKFTVLDGNNDHYRVNIWEARVGLTYKFDGSGWGKGPVAAKY